MARFNPFPRIKSQHGAPMGRHGASAADFAYHTGPLYARHCGGDGYYDRGGAYWGHSKVCAVWTRGGAICAYIEASTPEEAIRIAREASGMA